MSSQIFLHVGMSKTATTVLQNTFFEHHPELINVGKPNVRSYPEIVEITESIKLGEDAGFDADACRARADEALADIRSTGKPIMISNENFTNRSDYLVEPARQLGQVFPDARILITLREQYDWLQSLYFVDLQKTTRAHRAAPMSFDQWLEDNRASAQKGRSNCWDRLRYDKLVSVYDDIFGRDNVQVMFYEDFVRQKKAFLQALSEFLGVEANGFDQETEPLQQSKERRRVSARRAALLSRKGQFLEASWHALPAPLRNVFRSYLDSGEAAVAQISAPTRDQIAQVVTPCNQWLVKRTGVDLKSKGYRT